MPLNARYVHPFSTTMRSGRQYTMAALVKDAWTAPATASATAFISTGIAGPNATTLQSDVGSGAWDGARGADGINVVPRNVVVTVSHDTSIVACNGIITGVDVYGREITETWAVTATGTSKTSTGVTAFKKVRSISVTSASDARANTVKLGFGAVLGLSFTCPIASAVKEIAAGSVVTNGTIVAANTAANTDKRGTYSPNSAPNGSNNYAVWYISDEPHKSDET